mmetsp:Transcript_25739/g.52701  ORF Transcript_25739/g.52701 Transcript_25739/m.52701 type:complete len:173 (-) Transcript_25739:250-768(-)|eukprot:CAMPEP_0183311712 /NCGR_PEP_ID=MMETSP0160_2-20130417/38502_1 /TAXON_ID=2839 ORGANISM="Odontella Sinensis, Strain Grunow 1884" /NCGR_SAMPLE_ID=MMETSP0160_2 /ASSEMBLY_ACC=CAM_ASM_000250 /LENGTH=172 /DNA_ID=CAMNT_0025476379 /DNA_START=73 /DNA_END=591 /DNA_ORIENTATION=+
MIRARLSPLLLVCGLLAAVFANTASAFVIGGGNALSSPKTQDFAAAARPPVARSASTALSMGLFDDIGKMIKGMTTRASASHILIKGGAEAANRLEDLKAEIGDNPVKFAEAAAAYSACPSGRSGGNLGEFGRGQMVKEFDQVVFNDEVGVVHGPVKTQFGYHLILISERTD